MRPTDVLILHTAATWSLIGLIWTVQTVQYPGFSYVGSRDFPAFHEHHCRRITWVVAPLMLAELSTGFWLWLRPPPGLSPTTLAVGLALLLGNWLATIVLFVPMHGRIHGDRGRIIERLVRANWIRTSTWSLRGFWTLAALKGIGS